MNDPWFTNVARAGSIRPAHRRRRHVKPWVPLCVFLIVAGLIHYATADTPGMGLLFVWIAVGILVLGAAVDGDDED